MDIESASMMQPSLVRPNFAQGAQSGEPMPKRMAQEFETLMLSQLIKQMRKSSGGEGLFPGDDSDTYGGMFDMMIGKFLSESGGFGLADQLSGSFEGIGLESASQLAGREDVSQSTTVQQAQQIYQSMNTGKESNK
ncbi:MAG: rod-binding protein [Fuerstiella sp.]